ncbi:MAG: hypothetical protein FJ222_08050 [Lentisphaerae bacterium]|nr:hypothetical protein [Lentisphaerota bacterium]
MNQKAMTCFSLMASALTLTGCLHHPPGAAPSLTPPGPSHIAIVNVGGALDAAALRAAVAETREVLPVNLVVRELSAESQSRLIARAGALRADEPLAALTIYLVNDPDGDDRLACAGRWAVINVRTLGVDVADAAIRQNRATKVVMKGVGLACGLGGNPDPRCVMYYKSFDRDGLDGTSASYGPYAYSVLMDTLLSLANGALVPPEE